MDLFKRLCRLAGKEMDAALVLEKRVHHTLIYGITRTRNNGRKIIKHTSRILQRMSEE